MTDFITEENSLLILCNECEDCIKQNLFSLLSSKIEEIQANLSDIKSDLIANKVCKIFYSVSFTYYDQNQLNFQYRHFFNIPDFFCYMETFCESFKNTKKA